MVDKKVCDLMLSLSKNGIGAFVDFEYIGVDNHNHKFYKNKKGTKIIYEYDNVKKWSIKIEEFYVPLFVREFYKKELGI